MKTKPKPAVKPKPAIKPKAVKPPTGNLKIEVVPLSQIALDPVNLRDHPPENLENIEYSLLEFGQQKPIVVDRHGLIRAGNGTFLAAQRLGWPTIEIVRSRLEGKRAQAYSIADNRTTDKSYFRDGDLGPVLKELMDQEVADLRAIGYTRDEILDLLPNEGLEARDYPAAILKSGEWQEKWQVQSGDLWEIPSLSRPGSTHRLLCGDALDPACVARLFCPGPPATPVPARLFATDPPYGVDLAGSGAANRGEGHGLLNDEKDGRKLQEFIAALMAAWRPQLDPESAHYIWHAQSQATFVRQALLEAGLVLHRQLVWVKTGFVLGRGDFHYKHELCYYGWREGQRAPWYGDRKQHTIWLLEQGTDPLEALNRILEQTTAWEMGRENEHTHPTQKPIEAFARAMRLSTQLGDLVAEPFAGSGTQFVAAEQERRTCYGMELHPPFASSTLERLNHLGLTPKKL